MKGRQIGTLARELDVPIENIRYYERCGLMDKPARTEGNYRVYTDAQVDQLRFIINCRHLDMDQSEIRRLLDLRARPPQDCAAVNAVIDEHIAHIDQRVAELRKLSKQLHKLRESCNEVSILENCKIIGALRTRSAGGKEAKASRHRSARPHRATDH